MGECPICCSRMVLIPVMGRREHLGGRVSKESATRSQLSSPIKWVLPPFLSKRENRGGGHQGWGVGCCKRGRLELSVWPTRCFACQAMPGARRTQPSDAGLGATSTARPGLNGTLGVAKIRRGSSKPLSVGSTHSATGPAICINSNQKSTFKNETALAGPRSVDACGKA